MHQNLQLPPETIVQPQNYVHEQLSTLIENISHTNPQIIQNEPAQFIEATDESFIGVSYQNSTDGDERIFETLKKRIDRIIFW